MLNLRRCRAAHAILALAIAAIAGCAVAVSPLDDSGSGPRDASTPPDAPFIGCFLQSGQRCPVNATCPAADGCNTCRCNSPGQLVCTSLACPPVADAAVSRCTTSMDCEPRFQECVFAPGCVSTGTCEPITDCSQDNEFCGCDGRTFLSCTPQQPFAHEGPCAGADAGTLHNCDRATVVCRETPPLCEGGEHPSVIDGCWGPCVPIASCAPIPCDPAAGAGACPQFYFCDPSSRVCAPGR